MNEAAADLSPQGRGPHKGRGSALLGLIISGLSRGVDLPPGTVEEPGGVYPQQFQQPGRDFPLFMEPCRHACSLSFSPSDYNNHPQTDTILYLLLNTTHILDLVIDLIKGLECVL